MKLVALHGSPNVDGLTAQLARAALEGAEEAGADTELTLLARSEIASCGQCTNGWYKCRDEGWCVIEDDFSRVRRAVVEADAWVLVTPVYFGDFSEVTKAFTDRLRRCNVGARGKGLRGKPVMGVAAAGGSGRGTTSCLLTMDRLFDHIEAEVADLISVTRRSAPYQREAVFCAAQSMVDEAAVRARVR